jgi:hypothetical protein
MIPILAHSFGRAAFNAELNHRNLFLGFGLFEHIRLPQPIIASDTTWGALAAQIAVGALSVDVVSPWNVDGISILESGHEFESWLARSIHRAEHRFD